MKTKIIEPKNGGVSLEVMIPERKDPVDFLPSEKLARELEYMCIRTIGDFIDKYDEIMNNILTRYPDFFDGENLDKADIEEFLKSAE